MGNNSWTHPPPFFFARHLTLQNLRNINFLDFSIFDTLDACLMVHGSWLKAHGSWPREARGGSWLMARCRPGPGGVYFVFLRQEGYRKPPGKHFVIHGQIMENRSMENPWKTDALDACLMVHRSWLKAHGSWPREARGGSWLMAHGQGGPARP